MLLSQISAPAAEFQAGRAYVAVTRDGGMNIYLPGEICIKCDQTYDPMRRKGVPCENPRGHAWVCVSNWGKGAFLMALRAGTRDEARQRATALIAATTRTGDVTHILA